MTLNDLEHQNTGLPLKKVVRGVPVPSRGSTSKTWSFSRACKNLVAQHPLEAEIWSSEKCALGGYNSTSRSPRLLDQTSPDLFRIMREESLSNEYLTDFEYLHPFRRYSPRNFEVNRNRAKFCMFWPLKIFCSPKISDCDYKIERSSEHRAKFCTDWPTELGDYARKKRKNKPQQNISPLSKLSLPGGLIIPTHMNASSRTLLIIVHKLMHGSSVSGQIIL